MDVQKAYCIEVQFLNRKKKEFTDKIFPQFRFISWYRGQMGAARVISYC